MSLVIHAPNVHQGGGRTLLVALLEAVQDRACIATLDARLDLPEALVSGVSIVRVRPTLMARLQAEWRLRQIVGQDDILLCFGNLPPLFRVSAPAKVFLQNRYLLASRNLTGLPWPTRLRLQLERWWLRLFLRGAEVIVQTESMGREAYAALGVHAHSLPFFPALLQEKAELTERRFDFLYVASGEPHKNHRKLIEAWSILASEGLFPSLCLTLDPVRDHALLDWMRSHISSNNLKIENAGKLPQAAVARLYRESKALVYPSLFESFGLPLLEAADAGLPIVASELDYVRDVVTPEHTFDPTSTISIARAVKRRMGLTPRPVASLSPSEFLRKLEAMA